MANNPLSLTDKQLIHRLKNDYKLTQSDIADIVGCSQKTVSKVLKQPLDNILAEIGLYDVYGPSDNGCYRTSYCDSGDDGLSIYQQSISPYDDPTFQAVSDMELMDKYGYLIEEGED